LTIITLDHRKQMVIACDSLGSIGSKPKDSLSCSAETSGYFAAQVVLLELLAYRAEPQIVIDNLCVEMESTGKEILKGIDRALLDADLKDQCMVTGSSEENMATVQTGIGITAIGFMDPSIREELKIQKGDGVFLIGEPKVGAEVLAKEEKLPMLKVIRHLSALSDVREILPVGSKGIGYELKQLEKTNEGSFQRGNASVDLDKSAGPATCVLVCASEETMKGAEKALGITSMHLGNFY